VAVTNATNLAIDEPQPINSGRVASPAAVSGGRIASPTSPAISAISAISGEGRVASPALSQTLSTQQALSSHHHHPGPSGFTGFATPDHRHWFSQKVHRTIKKPAPPGAHKGSSFTFADMAAPRRSQTLGCCEEHAPTATRRGHVG
jgi:hypothetical protein